MSGEDLDDRADDFVLGLLEDRAETDAAESLATDPAWAAAVGRARDKLLPLDMTAEEQPLAAHLWTSIRPRLRDAAPVVALPVARSESKRRRFVPAALAACIGLLAGALLGGSWFASEPVVIAVLLAEDGTPTAVVEDYGSTEAHIRFVSDVEVPQNRQMQVWTLPSAEMGPVSLGVLSGADAAALNPPRLPLPNNGQLYEITLEPYGGSTTGRPTGTILAKGLAARQRDG